MHKADDEELGEDGNLWMFMGTWRNEEDHVKKGELYVFKYCLQVQIPRKLR